jgi:hypothetical protein
MANAKKKPVARRSRRSGIKTLEQIKTNLEILKKYRYWQKQKEEWPHKNLHLENVKVAKLLNHKVQKTNQ